jgi:hypothetical protein
MQIARLVWQGMKNREIGKIIATTQQVINKPLRQHLRPTGGSEVAWSWQCIQPATVASDWPAWGEASAIAGSRAIGA